MEEVNNKIADGLERISEVFKTLYWQKAKVHNISPIQIQIVMFVAKHQAQLCRVSYLAKEFNLTKATISDAVRVLLNKGYLVKEFSTTDNRSYLLKLSDDGKKLVNDLESFSEPVMSALEFIDINELESFYSTLTKLISTFNKSGVLSIQRMCFACRFYGKQKGGHYCNLLNSPLLNKDIMLDCPDFISLDE